MEGDVSDGELVRRVARGGGDAQAEAALCARFAPRVRLYGLRHLRDEERARDLMQAVMLALVEAARAGRIAEPELVARFVLGVARNTAARMREAAARVVPTDEAVLARLPAPDAPERVELRALVACLHALDERARAVVTLSFQAERSADEIAAALATTAGNVRVLRHRAIAALRRCLDGARPAKTEAR
jgi:RNA polymerase sigma-70 factor (ECF subfamily)